MQTLFCSLIILLSLSITTFAAEKKDSSNKVPVTDQAHQPHQCGTFQVTGYLKKVGTNYFILLAPGSRSEAQIILSSDATNDTKNPVLLPAQESFITAKIEMKSPMMHYRGSAQKISDVNLAVPNEMRGDKGTGLKLIEAKPCIIQTM